MSFNVRGFFGKLALLLTMSMYGGAVPKALWPEFESTEPVILGSRNISMPFIIMRACLVGDGMSNAAMEGLLVCSFLSPLSCPVCESVRGMMH